MTSVLHKKNASTAIEIERKIKVAEQAFKRAELWLKEHADFVATSRQSEYYLNNPAEPFFYTTPDGYKDAKDFLRVRHTDRGDSLCFKRVHRDESGNAPYCEEYETKIDDAEVVLTLFKKLGYTDRTPLQKTRTIFTYSHFEISMDVVKGIGWFIEIEYKGADVAPEIGFESIQHFLKEHLNVDGYVQTHGYTTMAWNPGRDFSEAQK